jgi:predicted ATP-grasp superfamily ATP-dependent carboligase
MKKNILVFPSASNLAIEIYYSLNKDKNINLIGCSSVENEITKIFKDNIKIKSFMGDKDFLNKLNNIIKKHKIDLMYPLSDDVSLYFSKNINKFKCGIISSCYETNAILRSKYKTYKHFNGVINVPFIYEDVNLINKFPVFIKPQKGSSSKDCYIVKNKKELNFFIDNIESPIVLEYLSGPEFTVDCFTDFNGNLLFAQPRLRIFKSLGASSYTKISQNEDLKEWAVKINEKIKFNGAWFFQTKINNKGEQCLLEIAPRIGASSGVNRINDVNLPLLNVYNHCKANVEINSNDFCVTGYRYLNYEFDFDFNFYKNIYFDFDDTLLINGKLNTDLIKFMFKCINAKTNIILISKHVGNLNEKLKKFKIKNLFEEIIHIGKNEDKAMYMKKNSILIDDSFSERKKAREKGFPAFPPEAFN